MKAFFARYLNEIVGLTLMLLMASALIAGQTNAGFEQNAVGEARALIEIRLTVSE